MAVKVMVAPAIQSGEVRRSARAARDPEKPRKPKRRRSSVYDADGNEVFISLVCLKCHKMRPLSQFGLRKMADGAIRNQPWCRPCRSAAGPEKPRRKGSAAAGDSLAPVASPPAGTASADAIGGEAQAQRTPSNPAAEVAAALAGGLRR